MDALRQFDVHLSDGPQKVTILDVLVYDGEIYLVVQGKRATPHVLGVRPSGLLIVPGNVARIVTALHAEEVERWATQSPAADTFSTS